MSITYQIFGNDGNGGPIDYTTILATVTATTWQPPALAAGSDWSFAVRAVDQATGLVDQNIDARCRVQVGPTGADLGLLPATPTITGVVAFGGGSGHVEWTWLDKPGRKATSFAIYVADGIEIDTSVHPVTTIPPGLFGVSLASGAAILTTGTPAASVPGGAAGRYGASVPGLASGLPTTVAVVAINGSSRSLAATITLPAAVAPPSPPDSLVATLTDQPAA